MVCYLLACVPLEDLLLCEFDKAVRPFSNFDFLRTKRLGFAEIVSKVKEEILNQDPWSSLEEILVLNNWFVAFLKSDTTLYAIF